MPLSNHQATDSSIHKKILQKIIGTNKCGKSQTLKSKKLRGVISYICLRARYSLRLLAPPLINQVSIVSFFYVACNASKEKHKQKEKEERKKLQYVF